jgi:hypothetical protein
MLRDPSLQLFASLLETARILRPEKSMTDDLIDKMCMPYSHAIALLLFASVFLLAICWIFASESSTYIPMVGTAFSLVTWALLHMQFRRKLTIIAQSQTKQNPPTQNGG